MVDVEETKADEEQRRGGEEVAEASEKEKLEDGETLEVLGTDEECRAA